MLTDILYRKKLGVPFLSLILIISCLAVSIPTYFFPQLYKVFGGGHYKFYIWQYVTMVFEHGSHDLNIFLHLGANIIVIAFFGVLAEKILGTRKFLILTVVSAATFYSRFYLEGLHGNGISGVIWAYISITVIVVIDMYKINKEKLMKDYSFYIFVVLILVTMFGITAFEYLVYGRLTEGVISHIIGTLVGFVQAFKWKGHINKRVYQINFEQSPRKICSSVTDKKLVLTALIIPVSIAVIVLMYFAGILTQHISPSQVINIKPSSISDINKSERQILITFSHPMDCEVKNSSLYSISDRSDDKLTMEIEWVNNKNLKLKFSRNIYEDENIRIILRGITDSKGQIFAEEIKLEYGHTKNN